MTADDERRLRSTAASRIGGQLLLWIQDGSPQRLDQIRTYLDDATDLEPIKPFGITYTESENPPMEPTLDTDRPIGRAPVIVGGVLLALVSLFVITKDTGLLHGTVGADFVEQADASCG